jgi:cytochrome c oxidase cbb3-type subunit 3
MVASVTNPVSIASQDFLTSVDDAFLRKTIELGRPGANGTSAKGTRMPAFAAPPDPILSPEQLDALVGHLRSWQREAPRAIPPFDASGGDAARGAEAYAAQCASCHGPDGWGETAPRLAGATFQATASDGWIRSVVLDGRGVTMPAFRIDDRRMADIIAFVRGLGDAPAP